MPGENLYDWSTTAVNNGAADTSINWAEGMARADVNNSARSMMAAIAKYRDLTTGTIVTGGSANAQTFLSGLSYTSIPTGLRVLLKIGLTNTGPATLNMDLLGATNIKNQLGAAIAGGDLTIGSYVEFRYDGADWIMISGGSAFATGTLMLFVQTTAPVGWTKQTTHDDKALRVVSGTASSGGTSVFSTVFGKTATDAHTLTTAEMPSHNHGLLLFTSGGIQNCLTQESQIGNYTSGVNDVGNLYMQNTGGGGSHTHPMDIRVQYVDCIIAAKD